MLSREQELEADLNAIIEYRLEFFNSCEDKIRNIYKQRLEAFQNDLQKAQKQIQNMAAENADHRASVNKSHTETTRLSGQYEESRNLVEQLEKENAKLSRKIEAQDKNIQELTRENKKDQGELKRLRHLEPDKKIKQAANAQKEVKELKKQLSESARLARTRKSEVETLKKELEQAQQRIKELEKTKEETAAA